MKKAEFLIPTGFQKHGLGKALLAGQVCQEAERLYPGLFKATALVNGTLRISTTKANLLDFRMIEGKLLEDISRFAASKSLLVPTAIRLTIVTTLDTLQQ